LDDLHSKAFCDLAVAITHLLNYNPTMHPSLVGRNFKPEEVKKALARNPRYQEPSKIFPEVIHPSKQPPKPKPTIKRVYPKDRDALEGKFTFQMMYWMRTKYHLTPEKFMVFVEIQNKACAICKTPFTKTPAIDHCHNSGKVRGLLCNACNTALGLFKDNLQAIKEAVRYLENKGSIKMFAQNEEEYEKGSIVR
jgi:hypothetical protein